MNETLRGGEQWTECRVCNEPIVGTSMDPEEELEGPTLACPKCEEEIEMLLNDLQRRIDEKRRNNPPPPSRKRRKAVTANEQQSELRRLKRSFGHLP